MKPTSRPPAHPGEILARLFLADMGINQSQLAEHLGVKPGKINEIVNKKRGISASMALDLAGALNTSPEFWLNLQRNYDLWKASQTHQKVDPIGA